MNGALHQAIVENRATLQILSPTKFEELETEYKATPNLVLLRISDQVDQFPSMGPAAFDDATLKQHLGDAAVVVSSAPLGPREEFLLAAVIPKISRLVFIHTDPHQHVRWAHKILELSTEDCMHIAEPDTMQRVLTSLRYSQPPKKEFVN